MSRLGLHHVQLEPIFTVMSNFYHAIVTKCNLSLLCWPLYNTLNNVHDDLLHFAFVAIVCVLKHEFMFFMHLFRQLA